MYEDAFRDSPDYNAWLLDCYKAFWTWLNAEGPAKLTFSVEDMADAFTAGVGHNQEHLTECKACQDEIMKLVKARGKK